jgi:large subunit ribosomal protein L29
MKFSELNEKKTEDLSELKASLTRDLFKGRMKNAVGQLDDTSSLKKARKDIARIETILKGRAVGGAA